MATRRKPSRKQAAAPKRASRRGAPRKPAKQAARRAAPKPASRAKRRKAANRPAIRTAIARRPVPRSARARKPALATATSTPLTAMTLNAPNGKPTTSGIGLTHHHMDYSTHDLEAMRRFFAETLGFTNVLHIAEANYLSVFITPTSSLGFMPPSASAPEQWQPPGEPNLYFFVTDVDAAYARLSAQGVSFDQPPTDMPWGHRLAILRDPEGRRVCLAMNLKR